MLMQTQLSNYNCYYAKSCYKIKQSGIEVKQLLKRGGAAKEYLRINTNDVQDIRKGFLNKN